MSIYAGQKIALLTQHGKEQVIAPVLEPALGCTIEHVTGFDTDQLGTFTRDIPRPGTQLDAVRHKARMGMRLSGLPLGIASEGSFVPDPYTGMFPWNIELLVLIDDNLGIEVVGMAEGTGHSAHVDARDWPALESFATAQDFPQHQLVIRPQSQDDPRVRKGIADWAGLRSGFDVCMAQSDNQQVFVETDLRAFANPDRMAHIRQAAVDLLHRLASLCPVCDAPGYWVTERQPGLPCSVCCLPTSSYRSEVWTCVRCRHQSVKKRTDMTEADPRHCAYCNR
ncbi:hypothetical protein QN362_08040 [Actimicrobium sp. CCC2.4]|uniref:DUF6671 family protein n=1 Tax=Actimicrobium sp. CCC2.4 TaxID=3048606 RepID=UPI002AC9CCEE|nr:DUF6671 family protein [Actimicrobium sp. CCC2.4]MEB0135280.1 hypothetical protein [Actimicrobium sp. CCC2.4]WPX31072.1 hypothetical protein RHM62_12500 [Actimicrobium sp. CCC2.4]